MKKITPEQLKRKLEEGEVKILDVRNEEKFEIGRLRHPHAQNVNVFKGDIFALEEGKTSTRLPFTTGEEVIVTCTTGNSARRCTEILKNEGYNVSLLEGGMVNWNKVIKD